MNVIKDMNRVEIHIGDYLCNFDAYCAYCAYVKDIEEEDDGILLHTNLSYVILYAWKYNNYELKNTIKISEEEYLQYVMEK
jgi:hypothetical protein